ncbi:MAG: hypothetical protein U0Q55_04335 [Vicinamibacterales bacterium]
MSAYTTRPEVRSVEDAGAVAEAGGVAISAVVAQTLKDMTTATLPEFTKVRTPDVTLRGRAAVVRQLEMLAAAEGNRAPSPTVASAKAAALRSMGDLGVAVAPADVAGAIAAVVSAKSLGEVRQTAALLRASVADSHDQLFTNALRQACEAASKAAGFASVHHVPAADGGFRLVASDPAGRALVTEFRKAGDGRGAQLETEVVGVTDGTCTKALNVYHEALARSGVQSGAVEHRWTGGVCETGLARELVRRRQTVPVSAGSAPATTVTQPKRRLTEKIRTRQ